MRIGEFLRDVREAGWNVEKTAKHVRLIHAKTGAIVIMSSTPSGVFWVQKVRADMRRVLRGRKYIHAAEQKERG